MRFVSFKSDCMDRQTNRQTDRQTDGWPDGRMDGQMDRQTKPKGHRARGSKYLTVNN